MNPIRISLLVLIVSTFFSPCLQAQAPKREFRGAWIATVKNIDWPSQADLYSDVQAGEFTEMLDRLKEVGMNAVIVQIRPSGDAFFESPFEPWSEWLTGTQGKAPEPYFDPLRFMLDEAHRRGMEFHAWINPFRADMDWFEGKERAPSHISQTQPEWTLPYGRNLYLDPGIPYARDYIVDLIMDVVRRYPVDAIHFDDYFYPYKIQDEVFPDSLSFRLYGRDFIDRGDWRRNNVNQFIHQLHDSLRYNYPAVQLGISPFGVWRNQAVDPTGSATQAGQTSYDDLYADIRLWLRQGWIDYVAPQAYFSIGYPPADFSEITRWWAQNCAGKRLYIGHGPYKVGNNHDQNWNDPSQIPRQIRATRENEAVDGSIFFSANWFNRNPLGFADSLQWNYYRTPALVPNVLKGDAIPPMPPELANPHSLPRGIELQWSPSAYGDSAAYYVIYRSQGKELPSTNAVYLHHVQGSNELLLLDEKTRFLKRYHYMLTAVDRQHNESAPSSVVTKVRWSGFGESFKDWLNRLLKR
jgi:uncharacterized lipoprotein YddW (UPF0748 family)